MRTVFEDDQKSGGITDFGDFSEGSCSKAITRESRKIVWIICFQSNSFKKIFIDLLRNLKINEQHEDGIIAIKNNNKGPNKKDTIQDLLGLDKKNDQLKNNPNLVTDKNGNLVVKFNSTENHQLIDGYWIILQDWSQCSLKCGGGTSTLQRMCIPPKYGGAPCKGESIINKPCNRQPCPDVGSTYQNKNNGTINKPIFKSMMISNNPRRYVKCKLKESDLMLFQNLTDPLFDKNPLINKEYPNNGNSISLPMKVIMNNSTFTLYSGEETDSLYLSFNLEISRFIRSPKRGCFQIFESKKKYVTLCPFGCDDKAVEEWDYDFNLFKYQCSYKKANIDEDELKKKLDEKIVKIFFMTNKKFIFTTTLKLELKLNNI